MKIELLTITPDSEKLIETAGRTCYQSNDRATSEVGTLIQKLIKSGHDSVLEHASATIRITGCSRAMTHQLVRHRLCSFSQQSQRYVNEEQFDFIVPPAIKKLGEEAITTFKTQMDYIQSWYEHWKNLGIKNEDARFVLPNACCSEIVVSANFRQWRHVFEMRCDKHAQWEIRFAALEMLMLLTLAAPNVFGDLHEKFLGDKEVKEWYKEMSLALIN